MIDSAALGAIVSGARLSGFLPYLQAELEKMEEAVIVRMDQHMTAGTLSQEAAQGAWIELLSYRRLRRRFEQKIRMGVSAGESVKEEMNIEPPLPGYGQ